MVDVVQVNEHFVWNLWNVRGPIPIKPSAELLHNAELLRAEIFVGNRRLRMFRSRLQPPDPQIRPRTAKEQQSGPLSFVTTFAFVVHILLLVRGRFSASVPQRTTQEYIERKE